MKKDYVIQGGVKNFLGQTEEVTAPKFWKSSPTSPDTELAYITDAEKGLLLEANLHGSLLDNKPNIGASGLLSFDGFGSTDPGQNRSGGDVSNTMDRGGDDGNDRFGSSTGGGSSFQGTSPDPQLPPGVTDRGNNVEDIDSTYTSTSFDVTPEKSAMDQLKDFISGGGIIGNTFKAISNFADNFNKNRRNKFMSTADIKEYELGTGKNWNPNNVTDKNSDEYKYLKNETNYFQQFNNDDNRNEDDLSTFLMIHKMLQFKTFQIIQTHFHK